jgi:hypothetical protein
MERYLPNFTSIFKDDCGICTFSSISILAPKKSATYLEIWYAWHSAYNVNECWDCEVLHVLYSSTLNSSISMAVDSLC